MIIGNKNDIPANLTNYEKEAITKVKNILYLITEEMETQHIESLKGEDISFDIDDINILWSSLDNLLNITSCKIM